MQRVTYFSEVLQNCLAFSEFFFVCMSACILAWIYVYRHIYTDTYIHTHIFGEGK